MLLTFLENVNGVTWQLSQALAHQRQGRQQRELPPQLSLVSWSTLSTDLAISDIYGNFYILLAGWLNIEKTQVWNKPATRVNLDTPSNDGNSFIYAYGVNQHQAHGVCHPIPTKQAVLVLRKNGQLML
ncbi:hypothetical protein Cantr_02180 [Candida viswanathii]|uniref:Mediator of RNA polymerase II transcription subunit 16 n=1 Tax=Candida viswanathii TaxID=5486 RepID=A0A367YN73_9ASCO|nr:hypothetical protein Cantr_02180 [Candida viswanathii]